jgi:hypothetical protein
MAFDLRSSQSNKPLRTWTNFADQQPIHSLAIGGSNAEMMASSFSKVYFVCGDATAAATTTTTATADTADTDADASIHSVVDMSDQLLSLVDGSTAKEPRFPCASVAYDPIVDLFLVTQRRNAMHRQHIPHHVIFRPDVKHHDSVRADIVATVPAARTKILSRALLFTDQRLFQSANVAAATDADADAATDDGDSGNIDDASGSADKLNDHAGKPNLEHTYIAYGSENATMEIWNVKSKSMAFQTLPHGEAVLQGALLSNSTQLQTDIDSSGQTNRHSVTNRSSSYHSPLLLATVSERSLQLHSYHAN